MSRAAVTAPSAPARTATAGGAPAAGSHLRRVRWAVRATLSLGVAVSVAANVLHAQPLLISKVIAAWPPLALLLTVELISRVPTYRRSLAAVRLVATTAIAGIAGYVSYWHMMAVADRYGETGVTAYLLPLSVDGLIVVASISLVELAGRINAPSVPASLPRAVASDVAQAGLPETGPVPAPPPTTPTVALPGNGRVEQTRPSTLERPGRTFVLPDGHAHNGSREHPGPANGHALHNGRRQPHIPGTDARPPHRPTTAIALNGEDASDQPHDSHESHESHAPPSGPTIDDPDRERDGDGSLADEEGAEGDHSGKAVEHRRAETTAPGGDTPGEPHEDHAAAAGATIDGPDGERDGDGDGLDVQYGEGDSPAPDDGPPQDTAGAVAYWHHRHPDWSPKQIALKINKSERTVRRRLPERTDTDHATASDLNGAVPRPSGAQPAD